MKLLAFLACAALAAVGYPQTSQNTQGLQGWEADSAYNRLYNANTEVTFSGKVIGEVDSTQPEPSMSAVTSLLVKDRRNGGTATVDLGPTWYVAQLRPALKVNDRVTVTGSKVMLDGRSLILARKIVRGKRALYLRELTGYPMWVASRGHVDVESNSPASQPSPPPPATSSQSSPTAVQGTVQQVITVPSGQAGVPSTVLVINTPQGTIDVDLGPQWYVSRQGVNFIPGTNISVTGGPPVVPLAGSATPIWIANGLTYGPQVMVFRTNRGLPVWSPWGY